MSNPLLTALERRAFDVLGRRGVLVAFSNQGYVHFTRNLLMSLRNVGRDRNCIVFCTDPATYTALSRDGWKDALIPWYDMPVPNAFSKYANHAHSAWARIMLAKLTIVHAVLRHGFDVFYTDGDVVWLRDCVAPVVQLCIDESLTKCLFMNDGTTEEAQNLCAGFFYSPSTDSARCFLDPSHVNVDTFLNDQDYLRQHPDCRRCVKLLPLDAYPNGQAWMATRNTSAQSQVSAAIHYNWLVGARRKRAEMIRDGHWFLSAGTETETPASTVV